MVSYVLDWFSLYLDLSESSDSVIVDFEKFISSYLAQFIHSVIFLDQLSAISLERRVHKLLLGQTKVFFILSFHKSYILGQKYQFWDEGFSFFSSQSARQNIGNLIIFGKKYLIADPQPSIRFVMTSFILCFHRSYILGQKYQFWDEGFPFSLLSLLGKIQGI